MCVCVCVLNEFWELPSLYDSCNWPEDSCYYTLQQGNTVCESVCACVCLSFQGNMVMYLLLVSPCELNDKEN